MAYFDRLQQASYTSPSGRFFSFSYSAVARRISHRIGAFEFPGVNGTLHQDKGVSGEIYPLLMYLHGPDYDIDADQFIKALSETGAGILTHPRYGRKRVQVLRISQEENLTDEGGQAVINATFQETLQKEFPELSDALTEEVPGDVDVFQAAAIANYTDQVKTATLDQRNNLKQAMSTGVDLINDNFSDLNPGAEFNAAITEIENNLDALVADPGRYAALVTGAVRVTAQIPGRIDSKLNAYDTLINALTFTGTRNSKLTNELIGTSNTVASAESINTALDNTSSILRDSNGKAIIRTPDAGFGFTTRAETLASVVFIKSNYAALIDTIDTGQTEVRLSDSYAQSIQSYNSLSTVVYKVLIAGLMKSFSLPAERVRVLKKDQSMINLAYEFYKNIDNETLDFFIETNKLSGDEILTIPRGRQVLYYA